MPRKRTQFGSTAISRIIRQSKDQAVAAVRRRYTGKSAAVNIAGDFKRVMSLLNTEDKQINTLSTLQNVWSTGGPLIAGLGTVAQGTASNQRTGDSIKINRIDLIMNFQYSTGTPATCGIQAQVFNWYLIRYLKTPSTGGTTAFASTEFLDLDGNSLITPMSFPNTDTNQNFQVMASGQVHLELPIFSTANSQVNKVVSITHGCSFHQDYSGASATTITDNMVFLFVNGLNVVNTGGTSGVTYSCRMWYIDN